MGFFSLKQTCSICGRDVGLHRFQISNKEWICPDCFKKAGFNMSTQIGTMSSDSIKAILAEKDRSAVELESFIATKKIGTYLEIDENQKKWLIPDGFMGKNKNPLIYRYEDIVDFELLEDGSSISKGGLGRALVGGALLGGVGAIVGGVTGGKKSHSTCESLKIKITLNNISNSTVYINFINTTTKKDSFTYKGVYPLAQECVSVLQLICDSVKKPTNEGASTNTSSTADEILKFKQLLDDGIITQDEFETKKKQLLGL